MKKFGLIFLLLSLVLSCGQDPDEQAYDVLISAENFLTSGLCDKAMEKIDSIPARPKDLFYIKIKASAHACKGGYTTTQFFEELTDLNFGDGTDLLSAFTTFNMAQDYTNGPGDREYDQIFEAIDTIAISGGISSDDNPSSADRIIDFGSDGAAELNTYLLYLTMTELGKYMFYYGNTDSLGEKGNGSNINDCFLKYNGANSGNIGIVLGAGASGSCTSNNGTAHPDLGDLSTSTFISRACEGIVLFNTFVDVFFNVSLGSIAGGFSDYEDNLDVIYAGVTADVTDTTITSVRNRSVCEEDFATNVNDIQTYFAYIFEILHSR